MHLHFTTTLHRVGALQGSEKNALIAVCIVYVSH